MNEAVFKTGSGDPLIVSDIVETIKTFIEEDPEADYVLTIGTDSESKKNGGKDKVLELITVIVIHRKGFGGKFFWKKKHTPNAHSLQEKIYSEVLLSLETAHLLVPKLKIKLNGSSHYDLEIHVDVGENGKTREMIKEVTGMVTGSGFIARTKPFSYAASNIADKLI